MVDLDSLIADVSWPLGVMLAWIAGEFGVRWLRLPRISVYALTGFALAPAQLGFLSAANMPSLLLLANIAFGLILFETGYRINLNWLRANPWVGLTAVFEPLLCFGAVYALARWAGMPLSTALLLAALSMATSPAVVLRVIDEQSSSGQVSERALLLSALSCALAVLMFKAIAGLLILRSSGNVWEASYGSVVVTGASVALGACFGVLMPALLRILQRTTADTTLAFALAVILLVTITHGLKLSPVLATLSFGLLARHRRIVMGRSQRSFGVLGDLLSALLFVFIAATLDGEQVLAGLGLGVSIIVVRQLAKLAGIGLFARASGTTLRKGMLLGMAMMPLSAFVILVLEQTRHLGITVLEQIAPLTAAVLILEIVAPIVTQRALIAAREVAEDRG